MAREIECMPTVLRWRYFNLPIGMKGRFRKGKKAAIAGKKNKLADRYNNWIQKRSELAFKSFMTYVIASMGRAQLYAIASRPIPSFVTPEEKEQLRRQKAMQIAEVAINSAQSIANIWK